MANPVLSFDSGVSIISPTTTQVEVKVALDAMFQNAAQPTGSKNTCYAIFGAPTKDAINDTALLGFIQNNSNKVGSWGSWNAGIDQTVVYSSLYSNVKPSGATSFWMRPGGEVTLADGSAEYALGPYIYVDTVTPANTAIQDQTTPAAPVTYTTALSNTTIAVQTPVTVTVTAPSTALTSSMTVTFSDNGAGGTFSAPTVVFAAGATASQTVTYTASATAGTVSISTTNDASAVNPAALSLTIIEASSVLTIGKTSVTADATTGIPSVTTNPAPSGGQSPVYQVYRAPKGGNTSNFVLTTTATTLPYVDSSAPCGDFDYRVTATDASIGTTVLDGGTCTITVTTAGSTSSVSVDSASHAFLSRANGLMRVDITGTPPGTQSQGALPVVVQFSQNGHTLCTYNWGMKVSGQSTASDPKKGYGGKLTNSKGKKADIKFGDWLPQTKLSLKAYYDERSLCRDIVANRVFAQINRLGGYPYSLGYPLDALGSTAGSLIQPGGTAFGTDGFAVKMYINGNYQGLYIERTSGDNQDWGIDDSNPNHYFLQFDHAGAAGWGSYNWANGFNPVFFDVASPAMDGYVNQSDFSKTYPTQYAKCAEPFEWVKSVVAGSEAFATRVNSIWDTHSILTYMLASELTANQDGIANNAYFLNWGGKWFVYWYDLDETFGQGYLKTLDPVGIGLITTGSSAGTGSTAFWDLFWTNMKPELCALWREGRDNGTITVENIMQMFYSFGSEFTNAELENEYAIWGTELERAPFAMIVNWVKKRIAYLDGVFSYAGRDVTVWQ